MKKILILSSFYPPANFVGADRIESWASYLHDSGFYPIIICRQWNEGQTDLTEKVKNNKLQIDYNEINEVHRLPYRQSWRDRCAKYKWLKPVQKVLTLIELIFSNLFIGAIPQNNFYRYAKTVLSQQNDISILIATGRPFQLFFIAHRLKKDFPKIQWIPDYRDEWTTHEKVQKTTLLNTFIRGLEKKSETKWTSNASAFITVSEHLSQNIGAQIKKKPIVSSNGFRCAQQLPKIAKTNQNKKRIVFSYFGTVYPYQPMLFLIDCLIKLIEKHTEKIEILIQFCGVETIPVERDKLIAACSNYPDNFKFYKRMSKKKLKEFYKETDFLLLTNYDTIKNWVVAKTFDYAISGKPILHFPSDQGAMTEFVLRTNTGFIFHNDEAFYSFFDDYTKNPLSKEFELKLNLNELSQHSTKILTSNLAKALKKV